MTTKKKSIIAIIPARGGSKGIPQKNIIPLSGIPLIARTIEAAKSSQYITRVVVSTDDENIATVSQSFNAEVINRPSNISGDLASSEAALLHTIETLQTNEDYTADIIVFLQCTSPFTTSEDIDGTIQKLLDNNADTALSVTNFHYFIWKQENDNLVGINHDKHIRLMRQEREDNYLETGSVYVMRTGGFIQHKHRFFGKTVAFITPESHRLEIDEPDDLKLAEYILNSQSNENIKLSLKIDLETIKAVVFDFDGVFTDNKVYISENGEEMVRCDRSDGMGISKLRSTKIKLAVMSTEINQVVSQRCKKLQLECFQALGMNKINCLKEWCKTNDIQPDELVFVGNDINDLQCLQFAKTSIVPSDAHQSTKNVASLVLNHAGGNGAVREICDIIMKDYK